jgi:hypothetical protein
LLTSDVPEPRSVLSETSTRTPPNVLSCSQQQEQLSCKGRIAAIDLRIGLLLLGEEGRKLLTEYMADQSSSE